MRLIVRVKLGSVIVSVAGCEEEYSLTQDFDGAIDAAALVAIIRSLEPDRKSDSAIKQEAE